MKKQVLFILSFISLVGLSKAQTVATFENLNLKDSSYWNGSDESGGFSSGNAFFVNYYDSVAGDFWNGFSASTMRDSVTASYTNMYSVYSLKGAQNSSTYAVGYSSSKIVLTGAAKGKQVDGFFINNGTYTYKDMKFGSMFSKKFGGTSGNDSDFFKIIISAWKDGGNPADTALEFYLADFRNPDNSKDYFITNWTWVNLRPLKDLDSLQITFESSDVGQWGINTPTYFYMDNFTTLDTNTPTSVDENNAIASFQLYPNPANERIFVSGENIFKSLEVKDLSGRTLLTENNTNSIDINSLPSGLYILYIRGESATGFKKFLKN
jgi:hypothetical protein